MNQIRLLKRNGGKIYEEVADEQCGFVQGRGTNNAIFIPRVLAERDIGKEKDLYAFFID